MPFRQKLIVYFVGVALGCMLLMLWPRPPRAQDVAPSPTVHDGYYPLTLTDGHGREVTLRRQPLQFVTLAPSLTETLFEMGLGERVLGTTKWRDRPPEALSKPSVGSMDAPSMEKIAQLWPDLVIATTLTPAGQCQRIEELGLPVFALKQEVYASDEDGLETLYSSLRSLGKLIGEPGRAARLMREMRERELAALERAQAAAAARESRVRAVILYGLDSLASAGAGSWPGAMLEKLGGENIAARADSPWPRLSIELIAAADPEVVVVAWDRSDLPRFNSELSVLRQHPIWKNVSAVKANAVWPVDAYLLSVPGPSTPEALERLAEIICEYGGN